MGHDKRAEPRSNQHEQDAFEHLFDLSLDLLCVAGTDGYFRKLNQSWEKVLGWSREELLAQPFIEFVHPEDQPKTVRALQNLLDGRDNVHFENRYRCKGGSYKWLDWACPAARPGSDVLYSIARDITEQKEADRKAKESAAALQVSENRLTAFVENSPALIFIKDLEGRYLLVNSKFAAAFGLKREDILGRLDRDFSTPEQMEQYRAHDRQMLANRQPIDCEELALFPDGTHCFMVSKFPLLDASGKITGICGIATEVTERRRMEDALRQSEKRYRQLVETARDLIFTLSPEGTFVSLNNALTQATGWTAEEWLGKHFAEGLPEETRGEATKIFRRALEGEKLPLFELSVKTKEDGRLAMEVTITALIEDQKVTGLLGVGRDVTDRKRMEVELRQLQKMESVGQLAAGVAHDFNNILTVIQGNTSLLLANRPEPGQQDLMDQILDASQRAANLTRQLLAFSRKQVLQRRSLNLNEVSSQMTQMLDRILGEDITLEFHYDTDLPFVKADSSMIEQVILNLAVNARDAMPKGGLLRISTDAVTISAAYCRRKPQASMGEYVCLSVSDTGCGIAPENQTLIFEPFFTTKEFGKGTGLGLATVYGIIKQHQGWVEVDSTVDKGTTFRLFLPAVEEVAVAVSEPEAHPSEKKGFETILVVEDDPMVRRMLETLLSMGGYQILSAASGAEAIQVWNGNQAKVRLLLTDMVMPGGISGKELAETLRKERRDLRVLISSGYSSALVSGAEGLPPRTWFLAKPYTPKELMQKVRVALDE